MKFKQQSQTYNDGVLKVYSVKNGAEAGNLPKKSISLKIDSLCYEERTVGMSRFWTASQEHTKIDRLLRTPKIDSVVRDDVIIPIDGKQYTIKQIQYPPDVEPACMDLSLERVTVAYDITGC